jgi:hypothetical protein
MLEGVRGQSRTPLDTPSLEADATQAAPTPLFLAVEAT